AEDFCVIGVLATSKPPICYRRERKNTPYYYTGFIFSFFDDGSNVKYFRTKPGQKANSKEKGFLNGKKRRVIAGQGPCHTETKTELPCRQGLSTPNR
ncbi:unnamed protein product, partial [marine sediment metagenome]